MSSSASAQAAPAWAAHSGLLCSSPSPPPAIISPSKSPPLKKSFAQGRILSVDQPGASRVTPSCPVFGICGGCSWQHVSYEEQLRQKKDIVLHLLRRHPLFANVKVEDVTPSPAPWNYRNRIQVRAGFGKLGFFGRQSHSVVDIEACPITEDSLNSKLKELRDRFSSLPKTTKIEIFRDAENQIRESIDSPHGELGFDQINSPQNENMVTHVIQLLKTDAPESVFDLYCGKGNFTFPLAAALPLAQVTGVELNARAIQTANETLQSSELKGRLRFANQDVREFLKNAPRSATEALVLDPPRVGADESVIDAVRKRHPSKIIYISCDPATFVRDALRLQPEMRLIQVRPFDMFPQTDHIELVGMFV